VQTAERLLPAFERAIQGVEYARKGVLFSEMLFLCALAGDDPPPRRVLESGRANGQSTLVLSRCFPAARILSVALHRGSPDVAAAAARLAGRSNVEQLFGDARELLPAMLEPDDVVLIDGPKGASGLRLAFRLLATGKPRAVFIHDCERGSLERDVLERRAPGVRYSDEPAFVRSFARLDAGLVDERTGGAFTPTADPTLSYGPTLACLRPASVRPSIAMRWALELEGLRRRVRRLRRDRGPARSA
jgi:hypothetical protein